jgi:hypothetical protein
VVVDNLKLPRGTPSLVGFARDLREREIEKNHPGAYDKYIFTHMINVSALAMAQARAVVEAVDLESVDIDPLKYL